VWVAKARKSVARQNKAWLWKARKDYIRQGVDRQGKKKIAK
jgi:hypothetical protein